MRRAEIVMAVGLVVGAGVLLREAARLPIAWTTAGPGPGFFPFWLTLGVAATALVILYQSVRARAGAGADEPFVPPHAYRPLLVVVLPIVAVIAFMDVLGIYLGGALYLAGYMWFVGRFRWYTILLVSVLVPVALFFLFERWFLMQLPKGTILETILYGR